MKSVLAAFMALMLATAAFAVEPDEVLEDPVLETRARAISAELRCLVCRNESIDESNADLARDLRLLVRERLLAGDADDEVIEFIVARYGEYVLLNPRVSGSNLVLWLAGPVMLLTAGLIGFQFVRRRTSLNQPAVKELSDEEKKRLDALMRD